MDGWWNCEALDQLFDRIMSAYLDKQAKKSAHVLAAVLKARIINLQGRSKAPDIRKRHYDTGNDFFAVMLPSAKQITSAAEGVFVYEDWHSFGPHYDTTLMAWYRRFRNGWDKIKDAYDQRFYRMWNYYLLSCAGSFRVRRNQLWQIVFSRKGIRGGYRSIR